MANPFKKIVQVSSLSKSKFYSKNERKKDEMLARTCDSCGASRPIGTSLTTCTYCGTPFMIVNSTRKKSL